MSRKMMTDEEKMKKKEYDKQRYHQNKADILSKQKTYYQDHKEEIGRKTKQYTEINHEIVLKRKAEYRDKNREILKIKDREFYNNNKERRNSEQQQYRDENRQSIRARDKSRYHEDDSFRERRKQEARDYYATKTPEEKLEYSRAYVLTINGAYASYKANAKRRKKEFDLTLEQFASHWKQSCVYCGSEIETIGLDRIDNTLGYTVDNTVPCCSVCNYIKFVYSDETFRDHVATIVAFNKNPITITHNNKPRSTKCFSNCKGQAKARDIEFTLSKDQFMSIVYTSCSYCGSTEKIGVDRIDNTKGYVNGNVTSCCPVCNRMKATHSATDFLSHINKIHTHISTTRGIYEDIQ